MTMEQLDSLSTRTGFATDGGQYLTFRLGTELYGVEILKVQEIKGFSTITPLPNMPPYVKGAMDLRGTVVPVVDLRAKFALAQADSTQFAVVIVVRVAASVVGVLVDAVSDVLDIPRTDIQAAPDLGVDAGAVSGLAKAADRVIVLLDIDRVLTGVRAEGAPA
jgi:purine-binding chemotaxis protein CheW